MTHCSQPLSLLINYLSKHFLRTIACFPFQNDGIKSTSLLEVEKLYVTWAVLTSGNDVPRLTALFLLKGDFESLCEVLFGK